MTARTTKRSGIKIFTMGTTVAQGSALLRYMVLARLLGPEQLGLAAILILTSQFFEAVTDGGLDRFLIQSREGNTGSANRAVHFVLVMRGLAIGALIALTSGLMARFYHSDVLREGLLMLAIAPAIMGLSHFDFRRVQRHHSFGPEGWITSSSEFAGLIGTVAAALLTGSFVAVAVGMIARAAVAVMVSHVIARRRYRIGFSPVHAPAMFAFGFPLMLNGVLLFVTGQGDRLFIGNQLGPTELGHYSAIILLIFYPASMLSRFLQSVSLPVIAAARNDPALQRRIIDRNAGQAVLIAVMMAAGFAVVAPVAVPLLYGPLFAQPWLLIGLVGILQSARFVRLWPTTVALATGHSKVVLWNGLARLAAFPLAFAMGDALGGLWGVVIAFTIGEMLAFCVSLVMLHRRSLGMARRDWLRLALLAAAFIGIAAASCGATFANMPLLIAGLAACALIAVVVASAEREALTGLIALGRRVIRR